MSTNFNPISIFRNEEYTMQSEIFPNGKSYGVRLQDLDSGDYLPSITYFNSFGEAESYALKLVNLE